MANIIDCRNMACPGPVITTKKLLETDQPAALEVLVDNTPAAENVNRLLNHYGYTTQVTNNDPIWRVTGNKTDGPDVARASSPLPSPTSIKGENATILVVISSAVFGQGDDSLGAKLMNNFLATLPELGEQLWRIILLNSGVLLSAQEGPALDALKKLEADGVSVLVCGTCLEFFNTTHHKQVGQTTNMLDVVTSMQLADKIIRI